MRFMMIMYPGFDEQPNGASPLKEDLERMGRYNDELQKAGVLLAVDGLKPTRQGWRVSLAKGQKGKSVVVDGPFTESKEIVGGFWVIQVKSRAEALEWSRRIPLTGNETVEVRQIAELDDFADVFSPQEIEREKAKRAGKQA